MSALLSARSSQPEPDIESGRVPTGKKGVVPSLTEYAQQMAGHASARTTKLYDQRGEQISLDEVERIAL